MKYALYTCLLVIALFYESGTAQSHELDTANEVALSNLVPIIQDLHALSIPKNAFVANREPSKVVITQGVVEDYDALIDFMLSRNVGPLGHNRKDRVTEIFNAPTYNRGHRRLPENISMAYPMQFSAVSGCEIECRKLLLEGYVKTVTIVTYQKHFNNLPTSQADKKAKSNDKDTVKKIARLYSKGPCKASQTPGTTPLIRHNQNQSIGDLPVLDLCIISEETEVPDKLIYYNNTSPNWPKEFTSKTSDRRLFDDLKNLKVQAFPITHWSMDNLGTAKGAPATRYEKACVGVEPHLPESAINLLYKRNYKKRMSGKNYNPSQPKIWKDGSVLCYGPKIKLGIHNQPNKFFPAPVTPQHLLDFSKIMPDSDISGKLNDFDVKPELDDRNGSLSQFEATLDYLEHAHPNYFQNILPDILPKIIETYASRPVRSTHRLSKFPANSLEPYIDNVESFIEHNLELAGCNGWKCDDKAKVNHNVKNAVSLLSATGEAGLPLLRKAELAGLPGTYEAGICMKTLTLETEAKFLNNYKTKVKTSLAVLKIADFPIPEKAPKSEKVKRLLDQIYMNKKPNYLSKFSRQYGGINIGGGYSFQKDRIVFYNGIDPEIEKFLKNNGLMKYLETIDQRDYAPAKALSVTSHADNVKLFLEKRLKNLETLEASKNEPTDKSDIEGVKNLEDNIIIQGQHIEAMVTKSGQRQKEIKELSLILNDWDRKTTFCPARISQYNY